MFYKKQQFSFANKYVCVSKNKNDIIAKIISKKKKAKRRTRREKYTARHSRAQTGHRQGKQQPNPRATEAREKGKRERREGEKGRGGEEGRGKGGAGRGGGGKEGRGRGGREGGSGP